MVRLRKEITHPWFDKSYTLLAESTIKSLEEGVNYQIQKPSANLICKYLRDKIPLIASVNYAALHDTQGNIFEGHDIVLSGLKGEHIFFIDPEHAEEKVMLLEDLLFAIASRRAITTSSYLIAIKR